jgi:hypothetical protein
MKQYNRLYRRGRQDQLSAALRCQIRTARTLYSSLHAQEMLYRILQAQPYVQMHTLRPLYNQQRAGRYNRNSGRILYCHRQKTSTCPALALTGWLYRLMDEATPLAVSPAQRHLGRLYREPKEAVQSPSAPRRVGHRNRAGHQLQRDRRVSRPLRAVEGEPLYRPLRRDRQVERHVGRAAVHRRCRWAVLPGWGPRTHRGQTTSRGRARPSLRDRSLGTAAVL